MNAETLKALKASIRKWDRNSKLKDTRKAKIGPADCALCGLFYNDGCEGCPVMEATGRPCCEGTPYYDCLTDDNRPRGLSRFVPAAKREAKFLRSLLPSEDGK